MYMGKIVVISTITNNRLGTQDTCFKDNNINVLQYLRAQSLPHDTTPCKKYILPFLHISGPPLSPLKTKYIYSL
jgi:hypothetical protein